MSGISRGRHQAFTRRLEKERATPNPTIMTTTEATKVPAWFLPVVRHAVALLLALSGPALMLCSLAAGMIAGSPLLGGLGLLGGALLTACGGVGLLWSLGRARRG